MKPPLRNSTAFLLTLASVGFATDCLAAVPATDITLQPPIAQNIPVITSLTNYAYLSDAAAVSTVMGGTTVNYDAPLFYPFNVNNYSWWDNLVAEQIQGRLPVVMFPTRGAWTLDPADLSGPGDLNPRRLKMWLAALGRAGATNQFKALCFVDSPSMQGNYNTFYGYPGTTSYDWSNTAAWNDILWLRTVKPWFDTMPSSYWYLIGGRPAIQFWGTHPSWSANMYGNVSAAITYVANQFQSTYGVRPYFIMDYNSATVSNQDPTLQTNPDVLGLNGWFSPPATSFTMKVFNNFCSGCTVPGFINPGYFDPTNANYQNPNLVVAHNKVDGSGVNGDTLRAGLDAAYSNGANLSVIEGWNDVREWAGIYRANSSSFYDNPSQYINIVRQYTDLRTVTLRLEAEAADAYSDTTSGNSNGQVFRRSGDLDVRWLGADPSISASSQNAPGQAAAMAFDGLTSTRWVTTATGPGWIQYDYGAGNSAVVTSYALTSASDTPNRDPKDWQFQGSNDGSTWANVDIRTGQTFATRLLTQTYTTTNTTAYRIYRLNVTSSLGGSGYGIHLQEIKFTLSAQNFASGWVVNNTAANEWVEFRKVYFSPGNYKFPIRYSAATAGKRVRLLVDNVSLGDITLPATGGVDVFDTISLGQKTIGWGTHTLRVVFIDRGIDLDWLFVRKADSMVALRAASNSSYVTADLGGNSTLIANGSSVGDYQKFSLDDMNGGTVTHNDPVSLQCYNGLLLSAAGGGGGVLTADRTRAGSLEAFTIVKTSGTGAIANGDTVALLSSGGKYVTVGSGNVLNVTGTSIGPAQTFTVSFSAQ